MRRRMGFWFKPLLSGLLLVSLALAGCAGDDGANGLPGAPGAPGANGSDVTVQDLANLGLVYSGDVVAINPTLDLSQTVAYNAATGALTVHFFLTDEAGDGIDITKIPYEMRLYVSELVPANPAVTDNPGAAWTQKIAETFTPATSTPAGTLTLVNAATGEYTYTAGTTLAASTNVTRVTMRARFRFRDLDNVYIVVANPVNASYDFLQSAPATALASSGADMVTTAACETCHGDRIGNVGHGGGYTQVKTCNHCHNVNYMATRDLEADLAFMIHRIHVAGTFTSLGNFSEVTYPQAIHTCDKCHNGPEASLANANPTRSNCGSCHSDVNFTKGGSTIPTPVDFATGVNHNNGTFPGPVTDDSGCKGCHPAASIALAHNPAPAPVNVPEFDVTLAISPPAVGTFYVAGDTPLLTVTLKDHATGLDVDPLFYTTAQGATGNIADTALAVASVYIYGPRNEAVPVLAPYTSTDTTFTVANLLTLVRDAAGTPYFTGAIQAHNMFVGSQIPDADPVVAAGADGFYGTADDVTVADPQVATDATGFKYQLPAIPAGMEAGTYMVRVRIGDYGRVGTGNYQIESLAFTTIQIGTATVEAKVSGDACVECHGNGTAPFHDERHAVIWSVDECLACHDKSGNHADYIGNRVHAVHRATATGDLLATSPTTRNWTEVTFPQPANNCTICHTNTAAPTPVWRTPDMLVCGGCHGAQPNAVVTDYPAAQQEQVLREVAAAQHMAQNGGSTDPTVPATLSCLVCHGEGRTADLFQTHKLIQFRALPVDPNE